MTKMRSLNVAVVLAITAAAAARLAASDPGTGDWPMWGGTPDRNMVSNAKGLATDWDDYAVQLREVLDAAKELDNLGDPVTGWAQRFVDRPVTRFEQRGIDAGRTVRDLHYSRR